MRFGVCNPSVTFELRLSFVAMVKTFIDVQKNNFTKGRGKVNAIKLSFGIQTFRFGSSLILNRIIHYLRFGFQEIFLNLMALRGKVGN